MWQGREEKPGAQADLSLVIPLIRGLLPTQAKLPFCSGKRHYLCLPRVVAMQTSLKKRPGIKVISVSAVRDAETWQTHAKLSPSHNWASTFVCLILLLTYFHPRYLALFIHTVKLEALPTVWDWLNCKDLLIVYNYSLWLHILLIIIEFN